MKRSQKQTSHVFHLRRVGLLGFLCAAFFIVQLDARGHLPGNDIGSRVLAYASDMSQAGLLGGTNAARANQSLAPFTLNTRLNASAQAKADDMATKDYWAHVAPDGTQPWFFFKQAGYDYTRAGENLAYGFATSQSAIEGWLNSPPHRANIMGDYTEVGFGIASAANFQGEGQQTIVVAHYGSRATPAPTPTPAPVAPLTPVPPSTPAPPQAAPPTPTPLEQTPTAPTEEKQPEPNTGQPEAGLKTTPPSPEESPSAAIAPIAVNTGADHQVSVLSMIAHKNAPFAALASFVMVCFAVVGYALTHRTAFERAAAAGETFVATHPGIDAAIVAAFTALILLTSYGAIH